MDRRRGFGRLFSSMGAGGVPAPVIWKEEEERVEMKLASRVRDWKPPGSHRMRRRGFPWRRLATAAAILLPFFIGLALLVGLRLAREGTLPNIEVGGVPVGGMDEEEVRAAVRELAADRGAQPFTVRRGSAPTAGPGSVTATAADLGYELDVEATVDQVLARGRQGNPFAALADHLVGSFATIEIEPIQLLDEARFDTWVRSAIQELEVPPREADLQFDGTTPRPVYPGAGAAIDEEQLRTRAREAVLRPGPDAIAVSTTPIEPATTVVELNDSLAKARRALSDTATLIRGEGSITFTPEQLAVVLEAEPVVEDGVARLRLFVHPRRLERLVGDDAERLESPPVDASFVVGGGQVQIVPSEHGVAFDPEEAARKLLKAALSRKRTARVRGTPVEPKLTTEEAEALNITEQVSSFTTYYVCCPSRVHNIHLIANLLDGTVVRPGKVFSINRRIGERTLEKGFVAAPGIVNGEFVDQPGGGISQFATTMFNAIFFAGYDILEYQPHSYWFSRYPMGREATLSFPKPDLRFRNDSDAGLYIDTSYTDTSITVTFYGNTGVEVESVTGQPYNLIAIPEECEVNPSLKKGEEVVVQEGIQGFTVQVSRVLRYPGGRVEEEVYTTQYDALSTIVERRSCEKQEASS